MSFIALQLAIELNDYLIMCEKYVIFHFLIHGSKHLYEYNILLVWALYSALIRTIQIMANWLQYAKTMKTHQINNNKNTWLAYTGGKQNSVLFSIHFKPIIIYIYFHYSNSLSSFSLARAKNYDFFFHCCECHYFRQSYSFFIIFFLSCAPFAYHFC